MCVYMYMSTYMYMFIAIGDLTTAMSPTIPGLFDVLAVLAAEAVGTAAATAVTRVLVAIASTRLRQRHLVARVCNTNAISNAYNNRIERQLV